MSEANPTTMEMLYLPVECVLKTTPAFELLVKNREMFISQRAVESHLGYAVSQIKKARGCNKRVWNPWPEEPPMPEDYCTFIADARKHPKPLAESGVDLRTCKAAPVAKHVVSDILSVYDYGTATGGVFRGGKPVVFDIPKEGAMLLQPSEHALPIMRADYQAMRQMIYGDYPSFDELLETLKELESDINALV